MQARLLQGGALDLRRREGVQQLLPVDLGVEVEADPILGSSGSSRALGGAGLGDPTCRQGLQAEVGVVGDLLGSAGVDHHLAIVNSHRSFRDICGNHHLADPLWRPFENLGLRLHRHPGMQRQDLEPITSEFGRQPLPESLDIVPPGHKNQYASRVLPLRRVTLAALLELEVDVHHQRLDERVVEDEPLGGLQPVMLPCPVEEALLGDGDLHVRLQEIVEVLLLHHAGVPQVLKYHLGLEDLLLHRLPHGQDPWPKERAQQLVAEQRIRHLLQVQLRDLVRSARDGDVGTVREVVLEHVDIQSCGHQDQPQLRSVRNELLQENEAKIAQLVALMQLIKDDAADAHELRV
mmetsp:Transcript_59039/g.157918  ORF Transcript_59039/g.157918 Transcript_59039/m.157918 type:complete len:349 (-) Transcript_59039:813-1859(-)